MKEPIAASFNSVGLRLVLEVFKYHQRHGYHAHLFKTEEKHRLGHRRHLAR